MTHNPETGEIAEEKYPNIAKAISGVMADLTPVEKGGKHQFFNFNYARMQDVLAVLTPLLGKHGLAIIPNEYDCKIDEQGIMWARYQFTIAHYSGEVCPVSPLWTGLSNTKHPKGGFDDKCMNKCATAARKYFLLSLFQIPTSDVDEPDHGSNDRPPQPKPVPTKQPPRKMVNGPHTLPTDGMTMGSWTELYISWIGSAKTKEELIQWDRLNDETLVKVNAKAPEQYDKITKATNDMVAKVTPKPPPPSEDKDLELVTSGIEPPGEVVWEDIPEDK